MIICEIALAFVYNKVCVLSVFNAHDFIIFKKRVKPGNKHSKTVEEKLLRMKCIVTSCLERFMNKVTDHLVSIRADRCANPGISAVGLRADWTPEVTLTWTTSPCLLHRGQDYFLKERRINVTLLLSLQHNHINVTVFLTFWWKLTNIISWASETVYITHILYHNYHLQIIYTVEYSPMCTTQTVFVWINYIITFLWSDWTSSVFIRQYESFSFIL